MNYQIIKDEIKLLEYIDWLPDLNENEKFYGCLFARKKYLPDQIKSNDKTQLKRFLTDKTRMVEKIKQLEVEVGAYQLRDKAAPQDSLVLYINPNPRDLLKATYDVVINLTQLLRDQNRSFNPHKEVLNVIQQTPSRKVYLDFDIDSKEVDLEQLKTMVNPSCLHILDTRGGYHVLIELAKLEPSYKKTFYQAISSLGVDQVGDQFMPVPGCVQGGYIPRFVK